MRNPIVAPAPGLPPTRASLPPPPTDNELEFGFADDAYEAVPESMHAGVQAMEDETYENADTAASNPVPIPGRAAMSPPGQTTCLALYPSCLHWHLAPGALPGGGRPPPMIPGGSPAARPPLPDSNAARPLLVLPSPSGSPLVHVPSMQPAGAYDPVTDSSVALDGPPPVRGV